MTKTWECSLWTCFKEGISKMLSSRKNCTIGFSYCIYNTYYKIKKMPGLDLLQEEEEQPGLI